MRNKKMLLAVEYKMIENMVTASRDDVQDIVDVMALAKKALHIKKRDAFKLYRQFLADQAVSCDEWNAIMQCVTVENIVEYVQNEMSEDTDMMLKNHLSWIDEFHR